MATGQWQGWVNVKWKPGTPTGAWESWSKHPALKAAWSTQGDWDCSLWVDAKNMEDLEEFTWKHVRSNQWVEYTETHWAKQLK